MKQYGRLEGILEIPPQVTVKDITAKVLDGSAVKAVQTLKI
jgi:hypothetical protein